MGKKFTEQERLAARAKRHASVAVKKELPESVIRLSLEIPVNMRRTNDLLWQSAWYVYKATQLDLVAKCKEYQDFLRSKRVRNLQKEHKKIMSEYQKNVTDERKVAKASGLEYQAPPKPETDYVKVLNTKKSVLALTQFDTVNSATAHAKDSVWLTTHVPAACVQNLGMLVYKAADRFLKPNKNGRFSGRPREKGWFEFSVIPGRAKRGSIWETFTLRGKLDSTESLPEDLTAKINWKTYSGPLVMVLEKQGLVLPVKLAYGEGRQAHLRYFLEDSSYWTKIDLVRIQDRRAPGGWRYQAQLHVAKTGYESAASFIRRSQVPTDRVACVDANVGNLSVASVSETDAISTVIRPQDELSKIQRKKADKIRKKQRRLDRLRRKENPEQYELSKGQQKNLERHAAKGIPVTYAIPNGKRKSNKLGVPNVAYRKDKISSNYKKNRSELQELQRSQRQERDRAAQIMAQETVLTHGNYFITEDVYISAWFKGKNWGKVLQVTTPGRYKDALETEVKLSGGKFLRASTYKTSLSQTCICANKQKKSLSVRTHTCEVCGYTGDRDVVSAFIGCAVQFGNENDPKTASVNLVELNRIRRLLTEVAQRDEPEQSKVDGLEPEPKVRNNTAARTFHTVEAGKGKVLSNGSRTVPGEADNLVLANARLDL